MSAAKQDFVMQPLTEAQLRQVYASDQEMYPAPLTFERLQSWANAAPDYSISFYPHTNNDGSLLDKDSTPSGIIIVLPLLRPHWEDLLVGRLKEIEVDAGSMFLPMNSFTACGGEQDGAEVEVGLHVFHVEKFSISPVQTKSRDESAAGLFGASHARKGFAELAIEEAFHRATSTRTKEGKRWKICGLSALTATEAGKRSFLRMGYTPTGYREMFVTMEAGGGEDKVVRMMYEYPGTGKGPHQASDVLDLRYDASVSRPSEMVVKYL